MTTLYLHFHPQVLPPPSLRSDAMQPTTWREANVWLAKNMPAVLGSLMALLLTLLILAYRALPSDGDKDSDGTERTSWATICAFAKDQAGEARAGRGPRMTPTVEMRHRRYSEWCAARGHTELELVSATAIWSDVGGVRVALEPNIAPYHCETGVSHWLLWYEPADVAGGAAVDATTLVAHVRAFVEVRDEECCCFQSPPERRRVPQMAHAHVFLRPRTERTAAAIAQLRAARRLRSPWAEAERLSGRGEEVGF